MAIGVIGESLVDVVTDAQGNTVERPGGSPFNVAIGVARLGMPAHLFTAVGDDERGAALLSQLAAEGVSVGQAKSSAPTGVATASIDADGHATYSFDLDWDPQFAGPWPELDALHFGSLGSVIGPGSAEVSAVVDRYRSTALISYDPNWRNGVVEVEPHAAVEANASRADVVKLSADDAAAIYPDIALEDVAHALLDLGPALVVITKGPNGSSAWTRNTTKHAAAAPAEVVDTVGAGDAFMATLLSELAELQPREGCQAQQRELELVVDFASYVAAKTCERIGADIPRISEIPF